MSYYFVPPHHHNIQLDSDIKNIIRIFHQTEWSTEGKNLSMHPIDAALPLHAYLNLKRMTELPSIQLLLLP